MCSRSAKGGEKGDPNRSPWLAKMYNLMLTSNCLCRSYIDTNNRQVIKSLPIPATYVKTHYVYSGIYFIIINIYQVSLDCLIFLSYKVI